MKRIRGLLHLVFDAVDQTTHLVERTHQGVVDRSLRRCVPIEPLKTPGHAVAAVEKMIAGGVFRSVRAVNGITRLAVDAGVGLAEHRMAVRAAPEQLRLATPLQSSAVGSASWIVDHLQSTVNAFFGDTLHRQDNPIALGMEVRHHGHPVPMTRADLARAFPKARPTLVIFIHGFSLTEWNWSHASEDHYGETDVTYGTRLEQDLDVTPIYVRYNSGLRVAVNGRALSQRLTELIEAYPRPIEAIILVGYSMGGLVARCAATSANEDQAPWRSLLRQVVCIGSPHHGSPHARTANLLSRILRRVDAAAPQVIADLLDARSVGIRDLEHGAMVDTEPAATTGLPLHDRPPQPPPLVEGVEYTYLASTVARDPTHWLGKAVGDLFVSLPSAIGKAPEPVRSIPFHEGKVFGGLHHFDLSSHPNVYQALRDQIAAGHRRRGARK
jgi:pimeloyl-ACP methyl ester carboxylesterase